MCIRDRFNDFINQRFDLEQNQRVEVVEQVVDDANAVSGRYDGQGFVLLGQARIGTGRCRSE